MAISIELGISKSTVKEIEKGIEEFEEREKLLDDDFVAWFPIFGNVKPFIAWVDRVVYDEFERDCMMIQTIYDVSDFPDKRRCRTTLFRTTNEFIPEKGRCIICGVIDPIVFKYISKKYLTLS